MKKIGIDFGEKRVGIAVSNENGKMAFPHSVIPNNKKLLEKIISMILKEEISEIVIGESTNFSGKPNKIMKEVEKFAKALATETKLPIFFEPEFLTSAQAERIQGKNKKIDASAAAIILQSYLDKNSDMI